MVAIVDLNKVDEIARRIKPMADAFGLVVGESATLQIAQKAGIAGSACWSMADPALLKAVGDHDGWARRCCPNGASPWLSEWSLPLA